MKPGVGVGLPVASRCPVPPWNSARKETINKYGSSYFYLQNSERKKTSFLYKVAFLSYFTIVTKAAEGDRDSRLVLIDSGVLPSCPAFFLSSAPFHPGNHLWSSA